MHELYETIDNLERKSVSQAKRINELERRLEILEKALLERESRPVAA